MSANSASPYPEPNLHLLAARLPFFFFAVKLAPQGRLVTDRGRQIPLFQFETLALPRKGQLQWKLEDSDRRSVFDLLEKMFLHNRKQDETNIVRLVDPHTNCNCHGWIFAGGQFGIHDAHIPAILEDNDYVAVDDPRDGDLVVYFSERDVAHSGIVRTTQPSGTRMIESKWGPFGVYLHPPESHPFLGEPSFFRTARGSHEATIQLDATI